MPSNLMRKYAFTHWRKRSPITKQWHSYHSIIMQINERKRNHAKEGSHYSKIHIIYITNISLGNYSFLLIIFSLIRHYEMSEAPLLRYLLSKKQCALLIPWLRFRMGLKDHTVYGHMRDTIAPTLPTPQSWGFIRSGGSDSCDGSYILSWSKL
jgi:hypothetical protein